MTTFNDKRLALAELRQQFSPSGVLYTVQEQMRPSKSLFDAGLFAIGLHEMVSESPSDHAPTLAFALAGAGRAAQRKPLLVLSLASEARERGELYGAGLATLGLDPFRVVLIEAASEKGLLWAAEEGASCSALGAVIAVLGAREKLYGFTASRRLKLRQAKSGVPLFMVRQGSGDATAATARWHVAALPSRGVIAPHSSVPLLGAPRFSVRLERYAGLPPQNWEIEVDASMGVRMAAPLSDRAAGAADTGYRKNAA